MSKERPSIGLILLLAGGLIVAAVLVVIILRAEPPAIEPLPSAALNSVPPGATLYEIVPERSAVRFTLGELLRGVPTQVVGSTERVSGQLAVNFADLATAVIGPITIDASALQTDSSLRNSAIQNYILLTDTYPRITFVPTAISGLPSSIVGGETAVFTITGQLTILQTTHEETFAAQATAVSASEIQGSASATVSRTRYDLAIPSVENVANVDENVLLEIEFTAVASGIGD